MDFTTLGPLHHFIPSFFPLSFFVFCDSAVSKAMTGAYGGMTDESGGVVGLLETISADFSRLEADTKAEERSFGDGAME